MPDVLLVAATERELDGHEGIACGVGPVEAAAATARALSERAFGAVLHIGVAGGRGIDAAALVIGSEAVYCDLRAEIAIVDRIDPDPALLAAAQRALPDAQLLPIGTSAAVGGIERDLAVEAMEGFGVLRAAALAGVPALEVRAISNQIGELDRSRWELGAAIDELSRATPALLEQFGLVLRG